MVKEGFLTIRNAPFKDDFTPIEADCDCYACKNFKQDYAPRLHYIEAVESLYFK